MTDLDQMQLEQLPGWERIRRGLEDLAQGKISLEALLIAPARHPLRSLGIPVPAAADAIEEPELTLYDRLCVLEVNDAYSRYNSWRRELDSFVSNLQAMRSWER